MVRLVVHPHELLPHDQHGQYEQPVCHQLMRHHHHNTNRLGRACGEDGKGIAWRTYGRADN